ncbi:MAG: excinuclease ABC subunit UvrC [candidate division WOR-3 bacterium]
MINISLNEIPELPGVYHFKDDKEILYIGKAKNLRKRLKSYFSPTVSLKEKRILQKATSLEFTTTSNEIEALILEENEIKEHQPKYNIRLKDDKRYPYVKITIKDEYPTIYYTRKIEEDGSLYFGPYPDVKAIKKTLKTIRAVFPVRSCRGKNLPEKPCLQYHIYKCSAPCIGKITKEDYKEIIEEIIDFLRGKTKKLEEIIYEKMKKAAENLNFEMAAIYRNQLMSLREITKKQRMVLKDKKSRDIIGIEQRPGMACVFAFYIREGKMINGERYILNSNEDVSLQEYIRRFLLWKYLKVSYVPDEILIPVEIEDKELLEELLSSEIKIPKKGDLKKLLEMATRNAKLELERELSHPVKGLRGSLLELQDVLSLPKIPSRIEGFDISNIGGKDSVGSCVVFINGVPAKEEYRKFKIKGIKELNDAGMIGEIVGRRIKRLISEKKDLPDLILIDGGKAQLNAAIKAMEENISLKIPIIALAKRFEEIYLPQGEVISLPLHSEALKLLMRIRNEAHSFALRYHKNLRGRRLTISELDKIKGIGYKRKVALIQHFGSKERLLSASKEEISEVPGIGKVMAEIIYEALH